MTGSAGTPATPSDRRQGGLPRGRRASDHGRHVLGLEIEETYEAGRLGAAFGLLLLAPISAAFLTISFISLFGVPLAEAVRERLEAEVRRSLALFLIGGWGGIGVSVARQLVERRVPRPFGARLLACSVAGAIPPVFVAETVRRLVGFFAEPPLSGPLAAGLSVGAGAYLAAGLTLVKALRRGDLGRRMAWIGLLAALLVASLSAFLAVRAATA